MKRASWMVLSVVGLLVGGCVSQGEYDKLHAAYQTCESERQEMRQKQAAMEAQLTALTAERDRLLKERDSTKEGLMGQIEKLNAKYEELWANYNKLLAEAGKAPTINLGGGALDKAVDEALRDLAKKYGLEYDAERGVVRFSSDLVFDLGSTTLKADAQKQLADFANVINMPEAKKYDVLVVGHTDNVRIARPDTKERTPTNWHLSVYRAVSVVLALQGDKVDAKRLGAMGFGEERPRVANKPGGTKENRRVEVFLVPKSSLSAASSIDPRIIPGEAILATTK